MARLVRTGWVGTRLVFSLVVALVAASAIAAPLAAQDEPTDLATLFALGTLISRMVTTSPTS